MKIEFTLNGHTYCLPLGSRLQDLIHELGLSGQALSVMINRRIVPRPQWALELRPSDRIEIGLSNPSHCGTSLRP